MHLELECTIFNYLYLNSIGSYKHISIATDE
uniref:Uncharacterized protein n=1 Tax=Anguilla anguilla TaxID=7936 RepID=A0A0E9XA33_ANGAN